MRWTKGKSVSTAVSQFHHPAPPRGDHVLCRRDLICQSQGLHGGPLWSLPDTPEGDEPLPLILLLFAWSGQPRLADVLCQGLGSWAEGEGIMEGLCVRGKSASNNSQIQA